MLRTAEQDRSLGFSFPSLNCSGANINTLYRTAGPERHVWGNDTLSLPQSSSLMLHQQANNDANRNKEVGKTKAKLAVGKRAPAVFFPRLPCRCCSTPGSRRRISPTSSGKRISCNKVGINKTMMNANVIHLAHPCGADTSQISHIKGLKIKKHQDGEQFS